MMSIPRASEGRQLAGVRARMRVLLCDDHVVFAEAMGHFLNVQGKDVVAVTFHPAQAIAELSRTPVDVCLFDVLFGTETVLDWLTDIRAAAPAAALVLLSARLDRQTITAARAGGVRGVADKRVPASEIVRVLDRVHDGELVLPDDLVAPVWSKADPDRHAQGLAAFLTPRERQVLSALVCGRDAARLARELGIAETTARCHIQSVLGKLRAHSRVEAVTTAVRFGMIDPRTGQWLLPVA